MLFFLQYHYLSMKSRNSNIVFNVKFKNSMFLCQGRISRGIRPLIQSGYGSIWGVGWGGDTPLEMGNIIIIIIEVLLQNYELKVVQF